eukprot:scaffold17829_cov30-Tisochrysis_lutea.AAC.1
MPTPPVRIRSWYLYRTLGPALRSNPCCAAGSRAAARFPLRAISAPLRHRLGRRGAIGRVGANLGRAANVGVGLDAALVVRAPSTAYQLHLIVGCLREYGAPQQTTNGVRRNIVFEQAGQLLWRQAELEVRFSVKRLGVHPTLAWRVRATKQQEISREAVA